jgi:hypothetical protein
MAKITGALLASPLTSPSALARDGRTPVWAATGGRFMRALGPGSVASILKIALDCAYLVLLVAQAITLILIIGVLVALPFLSSLHGGHFNFDGHPEDLAMLLGRWPSVEAVLFTGGLYLAALIVIVNRLRRVFETLTVGDPFRPENVGRLRTVGLSLIALEVVGYLFRLAAQWATFDLDSGVKFSISLSGWFAILAVFVLAEVFREGARLRSDAELTI